MSDDRSFLIAPACSGVNFLVTAFLMLALGKLWRHRPDGIGFHFIPIGLAIAYVNDRRKHGKDLDGALYAKAGPDVDLAQSCRNAPFEGIVIYLGFLLLLFVISETLDPNVQLQTHSRWRKARRYLLPLAIYYATTLGIPIANGAFRRGLGASEFWHHALFVLFTPIALLLVIAGSHYCVKQCGNAPGLGGRAARVMRRLGIKDLGHLSEHRFR